MKNQDDAIKELLSLFELWESLALKDPLRLWPSYVLEGVRNALKMPPPSQSSLVKAFWVSTHIQYSMNDIMT
jgi:hypothetical protein